MDCDDEGNLIEIEDPVGRIMQQAYDELNRLASITDPAEQFTELDYDDLDNVLSVTDPRALVTNYVYNGFGEQVEQTSPDTGTSASPRDASGNVEETTDARSETGEYTYDALNRVTEIEYGDDTITLGYDSGTNGNGRLTSVANAASTTSFAYDAVGRVTERSQVTGSVTLEIGYGYDSYGRLESLTTPSGQALTYEYQDGRVAGIKVNGSYLVSDVSYQPFGPTTGWLWGNSAETSREYDTDGQLTRLSSAGTSAYTYNDDGTIETRSDDFASDLSWADGTTTFTVSSTSNRLASATGQVSRSYGYDAAGNTTSDGTRTFAYTDAGRLKTAAGTTYSYNGLGERVKKTNSTSTSYFAYDEAGHLVGEYDASGDLVEETVWFGDIPVAVLKPNGGSGISVFYIHTDHLNTPRRITRPSDNAILWRWDSDPFGTTAADEDPDGDSITFAYNHRFPGQYFDEETGLHHNYYRDYDPVIGRYAQSDPIGLAGGLNPYLYANGNPLRYSDPYGLFGLSDATDAVFGAVWRATDWSPEGSADFAAGWGDELSFGITRQLRDLGDIGAVNRCSWSYAGGEVFGFVNGLAFAWAKGTKAAAVADSGWSNFSHSLIPYSRLKRSKNPLAQWWNRSGNRLNGDFVSPQLHTRMDAAAQFGLSPQWLAANPLFSPARQLLNRIPYVPGAVAYGAGSAALNHCDCAN